MSLLYVIILQQYNAATVRRATVVIEIHLGMDCSWVWLKPKERSPTNYTFLLCVWVRGEAHACLFVANDCTQKCSACAAGRNGFGGGANATQLAMGSILPGNTKICCNVNRSVVHDNNVIFQDGQDPMLQAFSDLKETLCTLSGFSLFELVHLL